MWHGAPESGWPSSDSSCHVITCLEPLQCRFSSAIPLPDNCVMTLSVGGFLQSSAQPHESAARPLQRAAGHIKWTRPLVDSGCRHGKV